MTFDELRGLAAGFQPAKLLLTALDLGLFDVLSSGPKDAAAIASALGLDVRATGIVANGLVAMELLKVGPAGYGNGETAARFLTRGSPEYRGEILRHLHAAWEDWTDLGETWRVGRSPVRRKNQQLPSSPDGLRNFILGMENVTRELAPMLANRLPMDGCRNALDLGGGPGNYALAFVRRWPGLHVVHFDLPPASRIAQEFLAGRESSDRISFLEGDFLKDPLGEDYDFVWASQIVHMIGEERLKKLLAGIADALSAGGRLAIHDQFLEESKTAPRAAALFGVHMLVATEGGRTYSFGELEQWLGEVGLKSEERIDYGGPSRILLAGKPPPP